MVKGIKLKPSNKSKTDPVSRLVSFAFSTGSNVHVVNDRLAFRTFRKTKHELETLGHRFFSEGCGDILIEHGEGVKTVLHNVEYVPKALWCIYCPNDQTGLNVIYYGSKGEIRNVTNEVLGQRENGDLVMKLKIIYPKNVKSVEELPTIEPYSTLPGLVCVKLVRRIR